MSTVAAAELGAPAACSSSGSFDIPCESVLAPAPWGATCPVAVVTAGESSPAAAGGASAAAALSGVVDVVVAGSGSAGVAAAGGAASGAAAAFVVVGVESSVELLAPATSWHGSVGRLHTLGIMPWTWPRTRPKELGASLDMAHRQGPWDWKKAWSCEQHDGSAAVPEPNR